MRVAFFLGSFPVVSETFILRQITGLIDLGHEVDIYAEGRPPADVPVHPEVVRYDLLARTVYMNEQMPPESGYWEMPAWPVDGETWLPESEEPIPNEQRLRRVVPELIRCLQTVPSLAFETLDPEEYGIEARSLSAFYRLAYLSSLGKAYDVLHAHFGPVANTYRFARRLFGAPYVVTFHGYDFCTWPRKQGADVYARLFEKADAVTINSRYTRSRVEALGCPSEKLFELPVGLDLDQFGFRERTADETVHLLTVARLVEIKGHEFAIQAIDRVRQSYPHVHYHIVGEGPMRPVLERMIADRGLADVVTLHGARSTDDVRRLMMDAHLFLLASVTIEGDQEGQGLVLQEAQATGLPVIATEHGAFPEGLQDGVSGFLVPERDPEALAAQILRLIEKREAWPQMGRAGRRFVEAHYDIAQLNARLAELYASLVSQAAQRLQPLRGLGDEAPHRR